MNSLKMKEIPFEHEGRTYMLRCNMNVLADAQSELGGNIYKACNDEKQSLNTMRTFLAAMMNDYAEEQGWPERYTPKSLGRSMTLAELPSRDIAELVTSAIYVKREAPADDDGKDPEEGTDSKN